MRVIRCCGLAEAGEPAGTQGGAAPGGLVPALPQRQGARLPEGGGRVEVLNNFSVF